VLRTGRVVSLEEAPSLMEPKPFNPGLDNVQEMLESLKPLIGGLPRVLVPYTVDVRIVGKNAPRFETERRGPIFESEYLEECLASQS
jgi:hypothetical protein